MYASQVVDMRRQVDCVKFSLQQEQEKQRIVEKKTQELREMLSRELVESQRYVKLAANLHLSWIHLEKSLYPWCLHHFCQHTVMSIMMVLLIGGGRILFSITSLTSSNFLHNRNHVELWAKLELEQQERAKFGACLSLLSETVAQGYSQDHFKKDRVSEGGGGAISSLLNPTELQLVNQLREAKNLRSLAEARIETLKTQVRLHPYKRHH